MGRLDFVALGITTKCEHSCSFCYATDPKMKREDGDFATLQRIGDELAKAGVKTVELVGGDPARHERIADLVKYFDSLSLDVAILSNTHDYANAEMEDIAPYVSALETTIHGTPTQHDDFSLAGAFQRVIQNLQIYDEMRYPGQELGITLNFTKTVANQIYTLVKSLMDFVKIDYVQIQRIGPYGRANGCVNEYRLDIHDLIAAYEGICKVNEDLGIRMDAVDAFPLCLVPQEYHRYMSPCEWGTSIGYVNQEGGFSRCAVNEVVLGNILEPNTPLSKLWYEHPDMIKFREKKYLSKQCRDCDLLKDCGGGCPVSCGNKDLHSDELLSR